MKKLFLSILASISLTTGMLAGSAAAAGSASFSLSPASGTYAQGSSFIVTVSESGSDVNAVTAKLSYDTTKLSCLGVSGATSTFAAPSGASCSNGAITIGRYVGLDDNGTPNPSKDGRQVVGTITFQAIVASGTTSVSFVPGQTGAQIASEGVNIWNGVTTGGTYTLTAPAAVQSGQSGSTQTPTKASGSTSQPDGNPTSSPTSQDTSTKTTGTGTAVPSNTTTSTSSDHTIKPVIASSQKPVQASHTGLVTSLLAIVIVLAGAYWLIIRKRPEVAPATYKLAGTSSKSKSVAKKRSPAKKSPAKRKPTTKKK